MSSSLSQVSSQTKPRPLCNYHPNVWNNYLLSIDSDALELDDAMVKRGESLKVEVRNMLKTVASATQNHLAEKLILVDSIQRLGLSYHFDHEINQVLELIYQAHHKSISFDIAIDEDLHDVALRFRLLRQAGYNIPSDIFTKYTDKEGKFEQSLANDVRKLLSLYEAAHMRVHGEDILEKALEFTTNHLKAAINVENSLSEPLATEVRNALNQPLRKGVPRIKAMQYIKIYQQDPSHNNVLLSLAKIDFNILQKIHQKELSLITRWWKDLDISRNFPYARDRIVEGYFWVLGVYFEPCFAVARIILTKVFAMLSILDDTYDSYGTFEELQLFTTAIQRWDRSMIHLFPDYMKIYYSALLDLYDEIETTMAKDGRSYRFHFAKQEMIKQAVAYFEEAKWLHKSYKPTFEEYMKVALISSGYLLLSITSFLGMGDIVTHEIFEWVAKTPKIIEATKVISRLMGDIASHKFEREREHIPSAVECYAEQYGVSEETTCVRFNKLVEDAWKDINEGFLEPKNAPMVTPLMRMLNLTRVIHLLYSHEDGYTNSMGRTKQLIKSSLVDPMTF